MRRRGLTRRARGAWPVVAACAAVAALATGCNGAGEGAVSGTAMIPLCQMNGAYDLAPDFFGEDYFDRTIRFRIMRGGGPIEFTDHFDITITDAPEIARRLDSSAERDATGAPVVTLPVGPPYTPGVIVHAVFAPNWSCGRRRVTRLAENVGLWVREGTITFRRIDRGQGATSTDGVDPRTTDVSAFRFVMHDPRPIGAITRPSGSPAYDDMLDPNTPVGSAELSGHFRTVFDRGRPSQIFP